MLSGSLNAHGMEERRDAALAAKGEPARG